MQPKLFTRDRFWSKALSFCFTLSTALLLTNSSKATPITLSTPTNFTMPGYSEDIATGDLDGDKKIDVAVGGRDGNVIVRYGNGKGGFVQQKSYGAGTSELYRILLVDVNNDGQKDIVVAERSSTVAVFLNQGGRKFSNPKHYACGSISYGMTAGDFNDDGYMDLATANNGNDTISVLINNGNGTFRAPDTYRSGGITGHIASADMDGDGTIDLLVANYSGSVWIFPGKGDGKFDGAKSYPVGANTAQVVVADFNLDGLMDFATANYDAATVSIMIGDGQGGYTRTDYAANDTPHQMRVADMDGDTFPDLVIPSRKSNTVTVLRNLGGQGFDAPMTFTSGGNNIPTLEVGDFNGDGKPDVIAFNSYESTLSLFLNRTPFIVNIYLRPDVVKGTQSTQALITLPAPAPSGGGVVTLASSTAGLVTMPDSITIPAKKRRAVVTIKTNYITAPSYTTITATYQGAFSSADLTVNPVSLVSITTDSTTLTGGSTAVATVTLDMPAPKSISITLSSANPSLVIPPTKVTVPRGSTSIFFNIKTKAVSTRTKVKVTATLNNSKRSLILTLTP